MNDPMNREWLAWRQLCKQLAKLGVDINAQTPLASAIRLWGEELVALREANPDYTERALDSAREDYKEYVLDGGSP